MDTNVYEDGFLVEKVQQLIHVQPTMVGSTVETRVPTLDVVVRSHWLFERRPRRGRPHDHVLRQKWQRHSLPTDAIDCVVGHVRCLQPNAMDTAPQRLAEVEGAASVMDARQHLTNC